MGVPDPREGEIWGSNDSQNMQLLPTYEKDDLWFTRWQHQSAIQPITKLLWRLLLIVLYWQYCPTLQSTWVNCIITLISMLISVMRVQLLRSVAILPHAAAVRESSLTRQMSSQIACSRLTSPRYDWMTGATDRSTRLRSRRISDRQPSTVNPRM